MRAVVITEPGGPEVLQWLDVPDPVAGPGEVVIEVAAGSGTSSHCRTSGPPGSVMTTARIYASSAREPA